MPDEFLYGHMIQEYYVDRVREALRQRAAARAAIRTPAQVMKLRDDVLRRIRRCFGPMPERTPLNARGTGTVERRDYRIEKVIYESRPDFLVTANLYVPKRAQPPFPAVLGVCGHSANGKACPAYQAFVQHLARMGYLTLILDPVSQGERLNYLRGNGTSRLSGCCGEHNMMGNQMSLTGEFFGLWRVWDAIRGLDYLLSRSEADRTRVGVTGNSGGGTLSTYLTALDGRFTMAAPSCFVTSYRNNVENELPADSEQIPPRILAEGLDLADFFVARIPRPTLILGQKNDFFDTRGTRAAHEELRRLYSIVGAGDKVEVFIGPTDHGYSVHNREAMYRFFNKHAGVTSRPVEPRPERTEKDETLQVTRRGQVVWMGSARVFDFTRERAKSLASTRKPVGAKSLNALLEDALNLPARRGAPYYRVLRARRPNPRRKQLQSGFAIETEPGIQAVLHLFLKADYKYAFHFPEGKSATLYVAHQSSEQEFLKAKTPAADPLFALDVRGIGQLMARTCADEDFFTWYGSDYFYASHGLMLNESYCGRRVHDVLRTLDLFEAQGYRDVHLVGRGLGAIWATFAAYLHPLVKRVTLHNALLSYHELTQTPIQKWPCSSMVFGALERFDLPDCYRALRRKGLRLVDPWDAQMRPRKRARR